MLTFFFLIVLSGFVFAIDFNVGSVSYWDFDTDMNDSWNNDTTGCSGVNTPTENSIGCASGGCIHLDGSSDEYLDCGSEVGTFIGTSNTVTISMWVNFTSVAVAGNGLNDTIINMTGIKSYDIDNNKFEFEKFELKLKHIAYITIILILLIVIIAVIYKVWG